MAINFQYGIVWARDDVPDRIAFADVDWLPSEEEARREFVEREDKYWPSVLVRVPISDSSIEVVEHGEPPDYLGYEGWGR